MYIHKRGQHPEKFRKVGSVYKKSKDTELENDPDDPTAIADTNTDIDSNGNSNTENSAHDTEKSSNPETANILDDQHQVFKTASIINEPKIKVESENTDEKELIVREDQAEVGTDKSEHIDMSDYGFIIKNEILKSEAIDAKEYVTDLKSEIKNIIS